MRGAWAAAIAACLVAAADTRAEPGPPAAIQLAALAPADDARRAVAIGRDGEVYEPDGKGAWIHRLASSTADPVVAAGRAGSAVVALGRGVIYRLGGNGWSAIRLVQHGKAILGEGGRALAAVGRQLFALDQATHGEPTRLVQAPADIVSIGAGATAIVVATEAGVFRVTGGKLVAVKPALGRARLVSDRWALVDRGAVDLTTSRLTAWPAGLAIGAAAAGPGDALVAVGAGRAGLELVTVAAGKLARDPLGITGTAVGVVADRAGRAVVALSDGRIALRDRAGWTVTQVADAPAPDHPGPAPAVSG
ncbi:MAG TPA: hypothetical protein VHT91_10565 [Kofleriaceae bacterium]|nr:hypothetical protein [Kofleriaceae bacterium]